MKKTIIRIVCCLLIVALAFGISWFIGKGIPPNADISNDEQIEPAPEPPPAHTHEFGEWELDFEPTCTKSGQEKRTCECGYFESQELEELGHNEERIIQSEPSCSQEGQANILCSRCGELLRTESIEKINHSIDNRTITSATCTQEGTVERYCTVCQQSFETLQTSALGHKYVNGVCSRCGKIDSSVYALKISSCKTYSSGYINYTDPKNGVTISDCKFVWQTGNGVISMIDKAYKKNGYIYSECYFKITFTSGGKTLSFGTDAKKDTLTSPIISNVKTGNSSVKNFFVNGEHYSVQIQIYNPSFSKKFISTIFEFDYNSSYAYWFTVSAT